MHKFIIYQELDSIEEYVKPTVTFDMDKLTLTCSEEWSLSFSKNKIVCVECEGHVNLKTGHIVLFMPQIVYHKCDIRDLKTFFDTDTT